MNSENIVTFNLPSEIAKHEKEKCINLSKEYKIIVPLDAAAADQLYEYDIYQNGEIRNGMVGLVFYEHTFYYMEKRLLDFINVECGLLINMYEEEVLENDQLDKGIQVVELVMNNSDDSVLLDFAQKLLELLRLAKKQGTIVGFYF